MLAGYFPMAQPIKKTDETKECYMENVERIGRMRNLKFPPMDHLSLIEGFQFFANLYKNWGVGNCMEQSIVALVFLYEMGMNSLDFCTIPESGHYFLLVGGNVICDPWDGLDGKAYSVDYFKERQKTSKDIQYARFVHLFGNSTPFLEGTPKVSKFFPPNKEPSIINGEFVANVMDPNKRSGTCQTLHFGIVRYGFISQLSRASLSESPIKGVTRDLLHQSDEIIQHLKKLEHK